MHRKVIWSGYPHGPPAVGGSGRFTQNKEAAQWYKMPAEWQILIDIGDRTGVLR